MYDVNFDLTITHFELYSFLKKIDNYFEGTLTNTCKQPNLSIWAEKLLKKAKFITVRDENQKIVACMIVYLNNVHEYLYVNIVAVLQEYQNKGIAHTMFANLFSYVKNSGRPGVELSCHKNNEIALSFYKKEGFIKDDKVCGNKNYICLKKTLV